MSDGMRIEPRLDRIRDDIMKIAEFISSDEPRYTRLSFSKEDKEVRSHIIGVMEQARLNVRVDSAGNIIGRRPGESEKPPIMAGSHLDTVRGGGRFDGVAGVVAAVEMVRRFEELGIRTKHPVEVVVFLAEEPSPFGLSTIGSRGMAGKLSHEQLDSLTDAAGKSLTVALSEMGGDAVRLAEAVRSPEDLKLYLELHIEQGSQLYSRSVPIGVVTGIVGIWRGHIEVVGRADHAGTTPMNCRKDALTAASEGVLALERACSRSDSVVGTIGQVEVSPGSLNVVPAKVAMGMEMRSSSRETVNEAVRAFREDLNNIREKRGVEIAFDVWMSSQPVVFSADVVDCIKSVCERLAIPYLELTSGAGHDANHLAGIAPTGMIFVPSRDGRSHCAEEWTDFDDIRVGAEVLAQTVYDMDRRSAR